VDAKQPPPHEQWLHDNKEALDSVSQGFEDVAAGRVVYRVSWVNPQGWRKK
jgi:hypothetical protein